MWSPRLTGTGLVAVLLACVLAACANLRWDKPGLDAAALDADLGECRNQAYFAAARHPWFYSWPMPMFLGRDRAGRPVYARPFRDQSDLFFLEQDLFHSCMGYRGYELIPVESTAKQEGGRIKEEVK